MKIEKQKLDVLSSPIEYGWREMSTDEYHADKTAVNYSSLKEMEKSEFSFAKRFWGEPKEQTDSMRFGKIVHMAMLEPAKFKDLVVVEPIFTGFTADGKPTTSKNSKDIKAQIATWTASLPENAMVIDESERIKIINMVDSLLSNEKAVKLLQNSKPEVIGYFHDEEYGLNCRFMKDLHAPGLGILPDLKTTQDCRWEYFRKSVERLNYPLQMAFYARGEKHITGKEPEDKCWITVESEGAHETKIHQMHDLYEEVGNYEYKKFMTELKAAIKAENFTQRGSAIEVGEPTSYYRHKYEFTELT